MRHDWLRICTLGIAIIALAAAVLAGSVDVLAVAAPFGAAGLSAAGPAAQQLGIPATPSNLQVLPSDMSSRAVVQVMRDFAGSLGVRCNHCHVGDDPSDLSSTDFASDAKETKRIARLMMRMVETINADHLTRLAEAGRAAELEVRCATCHHGQARPLRLDETLLAAFEEGGAEAVRTHYAELRERYYGSWTYDFTIGSLLGPAEDQARRGNREASMALLAIYAEHFPDDTRGIYNVGQIHVLLENTAAARAAFQKCLADNPAAGWCQRALEDLGEAQ